MPSKSAKQHRLMEAAAHSKNGYDNVPKSVGEDFIKADERAGKFEGEEHAHHVRSEHEQAVHKAVKDCPM